MYPPVRLLVFYLVGLVLVGCAARPPDSVSKSPPENPGLDAVRGDIESYIGAEVRWGGIIAKVENRADETWIEVVGYSLRSNTRPQTGGLSDGRFIARFSRFVDPVVYEVGRPLTVVGTIENGIERPIGDYRYLFPIVSVEGSYLWQPEKEYVDPYYPPPWWHYDPWYHYPPHYRWPGPVPYKPTNPVK